MDAHRMPSRPLRFTVALAAALAAAPAAPSDRIDHWSSPAPSSRLPYQRAIALPAGGFVLDDPWRSFHYDADGSLVATGSPIGLYGRQVGFATGLVELRAPWTPFLPIGSPTIPDCAFARLDDGTIVRQYGASFMHGDNDVDPPIRHAPGPQGVHYVWELFSGQALRISLDCHPTPVPIGLGPLSGLVNAAGSEDAFVLGRPADDPQAAIRLQRIGPDGSVAWSRELPAADYAISADPAGGVLLASREPDAQGRFTALRIDGTGSTMWEGQAEARGTARAIVPVAGGGATLWLLPGSSAPDAGGGGAVRFDAEGEVAVVEDLSPLWPVAEISSTADTTPPWRLTLPPPDAATTVEVAQATSVGVDTLLEVAADAKVLVQARDGRLLLRRGALEDPAARIALFDPRDGSEREIEVPGRAVPSRAAAVAADAEGIAWIAHDEAGRTRLRLLDADGELVWEQALTAAEAGGGEQPLRPRWWLDLTDSDLCATRLRNETQARADVVCVARADGEVTVPLRQVADGVQWTPRVLRSGAARTLLYARRSCTSPAACEDILLRRPITAAGSLGAAGIVLATSPGNNAHFTAPASLGPHGVALGRRGLGPDHDAVLRIDAGGALAWTVLVPQTEYVVQVHGASDGRILRVTGRNNDSSLHVGEHGVDGGLRWSRPIDLWGDLRVAADAAGWVLAGPVTNSVPAFEAMLRLLSSDGTEAWRTADRAYPTIGESDAVLALEGRGAIAWLRTSVELPGADLEWRSLADGRMLGGDRIPSQEAISGDPAASEHSVLVPTSTDAAHLYRFAPPGEPLAITDALLGSWFEPDASGQGLFLATVPGSDAVYGGWFTYIVGGVNDRAHQRWYTLSGSVREDGTAELAIFQTRGGRFAQPPAVGSEQVGTATLQLEGCNTAQLAYAFAPSHNDGLDGGLALHRTLSGSCEGEPPTVHGFAGGAFFDPAASGQGLFLEPLRTGEETRLAAFWFTFDPEGADDDPTAQHWFTMLSDPIAAGTGTAVATTAILRTIGGSFDGISTRNTHRVGSAQLRIEGCDRVALDYSMDDSDLAGAHARASGSIGLQRIGACPGAGRR